MSISESLRTFLRTDTDVVTAFGERIFVLKVPDGVTYPFAVIRLVSDPAFYTQDGESWRETIVQVDVFDDDISSAYTNLDYIRTAVSGYSGVMGDYSVGAIFVREGQDQWMTDARHFKVFNQYVIKWTVT